METQHRWLCRECKREWLEPSWDFCNSAPCSITGNPKGDNCPVCGSPEIMEVSYRPQYPGLDIPRDENSNILRDVKVIPTKETVETIPSLIGSQSIKIKAEPSLVLVSSNNQSNKTIEIESDDEPNIQIESESDNESESTIYDLSDMD